MSEIPEGLIYTKEHEWIRVEGNEIVVGITDYAQDALTDVVWVELPELGVSVKSMDSFANVESVKSVSEIYAPVSGEVTEINEDFTSIIIRESTDKKPLLLASFNGKSVELNDLNLIKFFFKYPLMTLKVIFGIHFHALFLYLKKVKFEPHPKNKVDDISFSD